MTPFLPPAGPLLLRCRTLVTHARAVPLRDAGVLVENGTVVAVAPFAELADAAPADRTTGLDGVVLPAFTDAHSHLRALPLGEQGVADTDLETWVVRLTGTTALDPYDDTLAAAVALVATGVTTVQAIHHTFAEADAYAAGVRAVASALTEAGLRAELAVGITDRAEFLPEPLPAAWPGPAREPRSLAAPARGLPPGDLPALAASLAPSCPGVRVGVAPVAPQWCSDEALDALLRCAGGGMRLHTHLLESRHQRTWLDDGDGGDPVSRLDRHGLLGPGLSAAHGVWLTGPEIALLARRGAALVHCPVSNARLGSGDAPVRSWLDAGVNVALGMDSQHTAAPDMFAEMRAALAAAERTGGPLTPHEVLAMATEGGAAATGHGGRLGRIAPGFRADLICVATGDTGAKADPGLVERIVCGAETTDVTDVFRSGRPLVAAGEVHGRPAADAALARLRAVLQSDREARTRRLDALTAYEEPLRGLLARTEP
ncbi:amidohydrolase family protein [Streptomyces sp. NPDC094154]|uniref:amidohydrolase family protein n=1 Tax=unclassified Streptomyces TaxID=2593676 RepID=UPI002DD83B49|nr:amidohydrolase family protein [Streptomyces sp. NBC_01788]WSB29829.1 amidohydrolase family protein [Streptomyces sp. NBC_01788]